MRYRAMPGIMLLVACASTIGFAAQPEILVRQVAAADNGYTPVRDHGLVVHAMVKAVELGQVERLAGGVDCLQAPVQGIRTFAQYRKLLILRDLLQGRPEGVCSRWQRGL